MKIEKATHGDIPALMNIFEAAKNIMRASGNNKQWGSGYPSPQIVKHDIDTGVCYVVRDDSNRIIATMAFIPGPDNTYATIYDGEWLNDDSYHVIHRIATAQTGNGIARRMLDWAFEQCNNIRIDTHSDNCIMHHILKKYGFTYCGTILLNNGEPRDAFQFTK